MPSMKRSVTRTSQGTYPAAPRRRERAGASRIRRTAWLGGRTVPGAAETRRRKNGWQQQRQENGSAGGQHAQPGADVFTGGEGFSMEAAQAIDRLREGVEYHPRNRHGGPQKQRREDEVRAAAAELRFVAGEDADQLRDAAPG